MRKGFSTIEIMIAFAIMMTVLVGVILADFGAKYWVITSQTSNEALYKAKSRIEDMRAFAKQDFNQVISSAAVKDMTDASCTGGGLCYTLQNRITDVSTCSKYAEANVGWQIPGYPQSSTSLYTYLTNPAETIALGGDCLLGYPKENWKNPIQLQDEFGHTYGINSPSIGNPSDIDVLSGTTYITGDRAPYIQTYILGDAVAYGNGFIGNAPYNTVDAARDAATGRTYAYVGASASNTQMQVIDMTDVNNPVLVAALPLAGASSSATGRRIFYYDRRVYETSDIDDGPEFHVYNVVNPVLPSELGAGTELGTTVNAMVVHDQRSSGAPCQSNAGICRFAYLATSDDQKEVTVLDVTDPLHIVTAATYDLPDDGGCAANQPDAKSLALLGNTLYVGREYSAGCPNLSSLYTLDVTDPYANVTLKDQLKTEATVNALRISGPYLFMGLDQNFQQSVAVRSADLTSTDPTFSALTLQGLSPNGIDYDGTYLYAVGTMYRGFQIWQNP